MATLFGKKMFKFIPSMARMRKPLDKMLLVEGE